MQGFYACLQSVWRFEQGTFNIGSFGAKSIVNTSRRAEMEPKLQLLRGRSHRTVPTPSPAVIVRKMVDHHHLFLNIIPNNFTAWTEWKVWCDWGMINMKKDNSNLVNMGYAFEHKHTSTFGILVSVGPNYFKITLGAKVKYDVRMLTTSINAWLPQP